MERTEIVSQILAILEDVAEISPEDVNENSVLMDDLDLSSMEILTVVADLEETFGLRIPERSYATSSPSAIWPTIWPHTRGNKEWMPNSALFFRASFTITAKTWSTAAIRSR